MTIQYQIQNNTMTNKPCSIGIVGQAISIPFAPDNTDYQQFKKDIANGVELQDADGNPITGDALNTFIATLP